MYIRLVIAFAAMVMSWFCFENAGMTEVVADMPRNAEKNAVHAEMLRGTADTEAIAVLIGDAESPALTEITAAEMEDDSVEMMTLREITELQRAEEARLRAEAEQRRIAEQKRREAEAKRKAAA